MYLVKAFLEASTVAGIAAVAFAIYLLSQAGFA